jgi:hypothetical protein
MKSSRGRPPWVAGWRLHLIGHDPETGAEIEMGGGVFPIEPNVGEQEASTQMRWKPVNCG